VSRQKVTKENNLLASFNLQTVLKVSICLRILYCHELQLIIELDDGIHLNPEQAAYDIGRTHELNQLGIEVMRITNEELWADIDAVSFKILEKISQIKPPNLGR
jgi:very-short-patch-repair endonuclease